MTTSEYMRRIIDYDGWATGRVLAAAGVAEARLRETMMVSHNSAFGDLAHLLWAHRNWLSRWEGKGNVPCVEPPDFATLRAGFAEVGEGLRAYVAARTDEDFGAILHYENTQGQPFQRELGDLVIQVVNHGTTHRAEVGAALAGLGASPGDIDYVYWVQ